MSGFFEFLIECAGYYYEERIKNPVIIDPLMIPEKYPREQPFIAFSTNESKHKRRARRRHTKPRLKHTNRNT